MDVEGDLEGVVDATLEGVVDVVDEAVEEVVEAVDEEGVGEGGVVLFEVVVATVVVMLRNINLQDYYHL